MSIASPRAKALAERVKRLRLDNLEIANGAGLNEMTVGRALTGRSEPRPDTLDKIEAFVTAQEIVQRDALVEMHGAPEKKDAAA